MKAILMSIRPQWVAKILNGEKTIEIRKTLPKCDLPIDVYIYCTKGGALLFKEHSTNTYLAEEENKNYRPHYALNGKVVAKFTLNKVETIKLPYTKFGTNKWVSGEYDRTLQTETLDEKDLLKASCISKEEIYKYLNFKHSPVQVGYAWHIDNLEIFDKPKEISEFKHLVKYTCNTCPYLQEEEISNKCAFCEELKPLTRAPQSWQFIEV